MDFDETLSVEKLSEEITNRGLQFEYGLICRRSQINDTVIQSCVKQHSVQLLFRGIDFSFWPVRVINSERQAFFKP